MIRMAVLPDGAVPVKVVGCAHNASIRPSQSTLELTHDLSIVTIVKQQISRTACFPIAELQDMKLCVLQSAAQG